MLGSPAAITILIKAKDEASKVLNNTASKTEKLRLGMKVAGTAFTAAGVAGLALVDSAKQMNAQLGVTAINLGITTGEMRNLALSTTNVTFPLGEVISSFDLLARAGIKDTEVLKDTATAFDTLGDAIGLGASQVTEYMIPAMKTFGLSAEEIAGKVDTMTYLTRKTTMSLDDFNTMVGYTTPELVEMGLTIDDLTAILIHMEKKGFAPGRVMTREFQKAVTEATASQIPLTEAIGMTAEELEGYKEELDGATGLTEEYAEVANEQYGIMDRIKQKWSELTLQAGSFLEPLEPILAGVTALGPAMFFLSTGIGATTMRWIAGTIALGFHTMATWAQVFATRAATAAQWLWNAALLANPIVLIIALIAALIATIGFMVWVIIDAKDQIVKDLKAAWHAVQDFFLGIGRGIKDAANFIWEKMLWVKDKIIETWNTVIDFFKGIPGKVSDMFRDMMASAKGWLNKLLDYIRDFSWHFSGWTIAGITIIPSFTFEPFKWIPELAKGAVVTKPTLAMIGERGPEAVIPLGGGMRPTTINIYNSFSDIVIREEADLEQLAVLFEQKLRLVLRGA